MDREPQLPAALIEEVQRLRLTLEHVGAYVFTKDADGRYTYANKMVCQLFGQPLERIVGCTDECFFDLSVSDELSRHDQRVLKDGEHIESEERNIIAETGEERIYWTVKTPIRDQQGNITGLCGISTDITERRRLEIELAEQKNLLSAVLENVDAYVYMKDQLGRYVYVNPNFANRLRTPVDKIVGQKDADLLPAEQAEQIAALERKAIKQGMKVCAEEILSNSTGQEMHCWSAKIPLYNNRGITGLVGISTDITELINLKNKFHHLAKVDELTGVLTRRFLFEQANKDLKIAQRRQQSLALLVIDIDHFKRINDTHGHAFGDTFLGTVVNACKTRLREGDIMGRLGGDEFVIILNDTDEASLAIAAERLLQVVRDANLTDPNGTPLTVSISIGAALSTPSCAVDRLIAAADSALYQAKQAGRNCWRAAPTSET